MNGKEGGEMVTDKVKGVAAVYNVKSAIEFCGAILARQIMFESNSEVLKEFEKKMSELGKTISDEINLSDHMARHSMFPFYMALKPKSEAEFERLKSWARENGLFK